MLRKAATREGRDWDKMIPFLLFAYREVPQSSTGFSPFELFYGRPVRGPLDVLRESWEANSKSKESVVSYVLSIRDKLDTMQSLVAENMQEAQMTQKAWYDHNSCHRELAVGDKYSYYCQQTVTSYWHNGRVPILSRKLVQWITVLICMTTESVSVFSTLTC